MICEITRFSVTSEIKKQVNQTIRHFFIKVTMNFKLSSFFVCLLTLQAVYASNKNSLHTPNVVKKTDKPNDRPEKSVIENAQNEDAKESVAKDIVYNKKHIVMFHPWGTPSHKNQFKPLIIGLLNAGHSITSVFTRQMDIVHDDYTEIIVEDR